MQLFDDHLGFDSEQLVRLMRLIDRAEWQRGGRAEPLRAIYNGSECGQTENTKRKRLTDSYYSTPWGSSTRLRQRWEREEESRGHWEQGEREFKKATTQCQTESFSRLLHASSVLKEKSKLIIVAHAQVDETFTHTVSNFRVKMSPKGHTSQSRGSECTWALNNTES